jgi:hypothetical protein
LGQGDPVLEFVGAGTLAIRWKNVIFCLFRVNGAKTVYDLGSSHLIMHAYRLIDNAENTGTN